MKIQKKQQYFFFCAGLFLAVFYGFVLHENPFKAIEEAGNFGKILTGFVPLYIGLFYCEAMPKALRWSMIYNSLFLILLACVHALEEAHLIMINDTLYHLSYHCEAIWRSLMISNIAMWGVCRQGGK